MNTNNKFVKIPEERGKLKGSICTVVVTYNRKELLLKCLEALTSQSKSVDAICIIDNASTDGTPQLLLNKGFIKELPPEHISGIWESSSEISNKRKGDVAVSCPISIHYVRMVINEGGAGGFHEGLKNAYTKGYDFAWVMDDDTIPTYDSLERLIDIGLEQDHVGFVCSNVLWSDDTPHRMNIPQIKPFVQDVPFNRYISTHGLVCVEACSFVSVLIHRDAIKIVGYPIKEFFIWGDDIEYTRRITRQGYLGLLNPMSVVYHMTPDNYCVDLATDAVKNTWKHGYGIRNKVFMLRQERGYAYIPYLIYNLVHDLFRVLIVRKSDRSAFLKMLIKSYFRGLFFSPEITRDME